MCNDLPNFKSIFFALYKWDWEECAHCCWRKVTGFCFDEYLHTLSELNPISTNQKYKHTRAREIRHKFCTLIHQYLSSWICLNLLGKNLSKSKIRYNIYLCSKVCTNPLLCIYKERDLEQVRQSLLLPSKAKETDTLFVQGTSTVAPWKRCRAEGHVPEKFGISEAGSDPSEPSASGTARACHRLRPHSTLAWAFTSEYAKHVSRHLRLDQLLRIPEPHPLRDLGPHLLGHPAHANKSDEKDKNSNPSQLIYVVRLLQTWTLGPALERREERDRGRESERER